MCLYMFLIFTYAYVHGIYTHRYIIYIYVCMNKTTQDYINTYNTLHICTYMHTVHTSICSVICCRNGT